MSKESLLTGPDAWMIAKRKARYSNRDWIAWKEGDEFFAAPYSSNSVKRAMLASGTQGHFMRYRARAQHGMLGTWRLGALWFKLARAGY